MHKIRIFSSSSKILRQCRTRTLYQMQTLMQKIGFNIFSLPRIEHKEPMSFLIWLQKKSHFLISISWFTYNRCAFFSIMAFLSYAAAAEWITCNCGRVNELQEVKIKFEISGFFVCWLPATINKHAFIRNYLRWRHLIYWFRMAMKSFQGIISLFSS